MRRGAEASMDEIAKRAKIGPGTLYRHSPTRDDLLAAVISAKSRSWLKHRESSPPSCLRSKRCGRGYWSLSTILPRKRSLPRR
jgi:hypothetical protein